MNFADETDAEPNLFALSVAAACVSIGLSLAFPRDPDCASKLPARVSG